jgi:hypothetical protein
MNRRKLEHEQKVEQTSHVEQQRETKALTTAEEVLRADARQTTVPPAIAARLKDTITREPRPRKGILGRFFSR